MKILVTGATGFIGSHLVESLLGRGFQVRCLIRKTSDPKWLSGLPVEYVHGDCCDKGSLAEAVRGADQIFHLAAVTKAVEEKTYFEVNAFGTENLLQACLEHNPRLQKLIYLSSQAAAGPCRNGEKKKESDRCEPVSLYGQSKRMGEQLASTYSQQIPLVILRPSAVYGPRERDIYFFFRLLSRRINPCLTGTDRHISLCYIKDVVQALLLASEAKISSGEIFFLSDGKDYRWQEISDILSEAMEITPFPVPVPRWMVSGAASLAERLSKFSGKPPLLSKGKVEEMVQTNWVCDISRAKTRLGFEPEVLLPEGAKLTVEWYRREKWL